MPAWPSPAAISCQALPTACPPTILGARSHGVALGGIHSTLLVTMYSASQSTWVQPTNTRRIEAVVASHSLETCACMPNAPRKHVLRWQQGPRLAAKREIGHGLMRENTAAEETAGQEELHARIEHIIGWNRCKWTHGDGVPSRRRSSARGEQ